MFEIYFINSSTFYDVCSYMTYNLHETFSFNVALNLAHATAKYTSVGPAFFLPALFIG